MWEVHQLLISQQTDLRRIWLADANYYFLTFFISSLMSKFFSHLNQWFIGVLVLLLTVNLVITGFFTITVNSKLNEALDFMKPQKGTLALVAAPDCPKCASLEMLKQKVMTQNVELSAENTFMSNSKEGQALQQRFQIKTLPALIFESSENIKAPFKKALTQGSRSMGEKALIWEQNQPPYFDVPTQNIIGLVDVTYITDKNCSTCYNIVDTQKPILSRFGILPSKENIIDISDQEGKNLKEKYRLTAVPTMILSPEAKEYKTLVSAWSQVGTVESDGYFVFRKPNILNQIYHNLETNSIEKPNAPPGS